MTHTSKCSDSQREDCSCECNGWRHGTNNFKHLVIPSQIHPMGGHKSTNWVRKTIEEFKEYNSVDPNTMVEIVRSAGYFSVQTIFEFKSQENNLPEWGEFYDIVESTYQGVVGGLRNHIAQEIASEVIDETFKTEDAREDARRVANRQVTSVLRDVHLVCVICVELLKFYKNIDELTNEMAQELASNIVDSVVEKIEKNKSPKLNSMSRLRPGKYLSMSSKII